MAVLLHPQDFLHLLRCPLPDKGQLIWKGTHVVCGSCGREFPVTEDILELIDPSSLDAETRRELTGNTIPLDEESIHKMASKDEWSDYISHLSNKKIERLAEYLDRLGAPQLISLGSGSGFEIKCLLKLDKKKTVLKKRIETVLSSDLSYSALYIAKYTLKDFEVRLGRFTSNLDSCPVAEVRIPVLIYDALHHTQDMHAALERLMAANYLHILFVEPSTNALIRWLAKRGHAQRIEYSGLKPGRLNIRALRSLCAKRGYHATIATRWEFPEDYFLRYFGTSGFARQIFLFFQDLLSAVTCPFRFGNTAIVHLQKR